jgi:NAD(P)-dependent dehydrogenase (short-subunit alcohol dehydrogenase family)
MPVPIVKGVFVASKAGVEDCIRAFAHEMFALGIGVIFIALGWVDTDMRAGAGTISGATGEEVA